MQTLKEEVEGGQDRKGWLCSGGQAAVWRRTPSPSSRDASLPRSSSWGTTGCWAAWPEPTTSSSEALLPMLYRREGRCFNSNSSVNSNIRRVCVLSVTLTSSTVKAVVKTDKHLFSGEPMVRSCRKREARRPFLSMKVNLQFYYIPVSQVSTRNSQVSSPRVNVIQWCACYIQEPRTKTCLVTVSCPFLLGQSVPGRSLHSWFLLEHGGPVVQL